MKYENERSAMLLEAHRAIVSSAEQFIHDQGDAIRSPDSSGQTADNQASRETLRRAFISAARSAFFRFFTVIDGVSDPEGWEDHAWVGMSMSPRENDEPMLHDLFIELSDSVDGSE